MFYLVLFLYFLINLYVLASDAFSSRSQLCWTVDVKGGSETAIFCTVCVVEWGGCVNAEWGYLGIPVLVRTLDGL